MSFNKSWAILLASMYFIFGVSPAPDIIKGVLASSIRIESTSSKIEK